jgi:cytochrome P450
MSDVEVRGYASARQALAHPELSRADMRTADGMSAHVLNMEGADHVRHRQAVEAMLGAAPLPRMMAVIDGIVGGLPDGVPVDAADHLAYPVAVSVVDLVAGLGGQGSYAYWAAVAKSIDVGHGGGLVREAYGRLATEMPGLTREEAAANRLFTASAGFTNLANAVAAALQALAHHPAEYEWLRADLAARLSGATEELLRHAEPQYRSSTRRVRRDTVVDGEAVSAGRTVKIFKAEANRDPDRYADPDRLDLSRMPNPHLSFGHGRHYCPAAHLSRMVLDRVVLAVAVRFGRIEAAEPDRVGWDSFDGKPLMLMFHAR